jgi:hypothetical protein
MVTYHASAPPVGSVEVTAFPQRSLSYPSKSTAAQNPTDGHDTAVTAPSGSAGAGLQVSAIPAGSVDVSAFPAWSKATQRELVGHDIALSPASSSIRLALQAAGSAGRVDATPQPALSTERHSDPLGHDTPVKSLALSSRARFHAEPPPVGSVDVTTLPASRATQNDLTDRIQDGCSRSPEYGPWSMPPRHRLDRWT